MQRRITRFSITLVIIIGILSAVLYQDFDEEKDSKISEISDIEVNTESPGPVENPIRVNRNASKIEAEYSSSVPNCHRITVNKSDINNMLYVNLDLEDTSGPGVSCPSEVKPMNVVVEASVEGKLPSNLSLNDHYGEKRTYQISN